MMGPQMQMAPQMQMQQGMGSAYGSPYSYNPNPAAGGFQQQYYPTRNQNQYQPGHIQSNYGQ